MLSHCDYIALGTDTRTRSWDGTERRNGTQPLGPSGIE